MLNIKNYCALLRPKQWIKNCFVFVPLFFSGYITDSNILIAFVSFLAFAVLSSSVYIMNDWCDIKADRLHKKKKMRPLASGSVRKIEAITILFLLLSVLFILCILFKFSILSMILLLTYSIFNVGYSFGLKHVPILELMLLASGFVVRLLFGAAMIDVTLSPWILLCTGLLAMMLAVGKRRGDLAQSNDAKFQRRSLVGYNLEYLDQVGTILATATFTSYMIFCTSEFAINKFGKEVILTSPFVLFGILQYLKLLTVDKLGDDPTLLILKSKSILFCLISWLLLFTIIIYY